MKHICSACGKENASVHYHETVNGTVREWYLCPDCASKAGLGFGSLAEDFFGGMGLFAPVKRAESPSLRCPVCGMDRASLRQKGRFGCAACYDTFAEGLDLSAFIGKGYGGGRLGTPQKAEPAQKPADAPAETEKDEISVLRDRLRLAVEKEDYETAAHLRDEIRAKEGK
ncbi:MAG: UvrB/UvrC motif-containing protein [Clostridia bacterium]|nr:UvrB/UvrC motif-containing protein [Clostridia bacterium]